MVEHAAVNRGVVGSSPTSGAIQNKRVLFGFLQERHPQLAELVAITRFSGKKSVSKFIEALKPQRDQDKGDVKEGPRPGEVVVAHDQTAVVVQPGKRALDLPTLAANCK